ncbi:MAG: hypothetical protein IPN49_06325 [Saprospiraceae bacterium]|nr:hypothetical protein [Saprospiraceae bacterium]MBK7523668.1 hypothetical protein [Saprospiraceae bacterium]MBK8079783.1 hypothetical protein [Saprospiraceae bacterium]MBK8371339.1 hypothetical protein [Saprospiraceae bacterium]MBK8818709.1 hypothetical protein [Saprospiraceae bacterium]
MKQYKFLTIVLIFFILNNKIIAQCDNTAQWPAGTVNVICGNNVIVSNIFAGEYSMTSGYQDQSTLVFSSSVSSDFITLRKSSNNDVIAAGPSPLTILYFAADGNIEVHINTNAACGTENSARVSSVLMTCGCNNAVKWPTANFNLTQGLNTIATDQYAGDYNVTTGYIDGSTCTYASSEGTDFITLRNATSNIIIATGTTPLSITYDALTMSQFIEMHININSSCGTQNTNRTTTVNMLNIYRGGVDDGYDDLAFAEPDNPILAIYKGGNDDGYDDLAFAEPDNPILTIFKGGNDDGYDDLAFAEPDNPILAIYKGGNDDGYDDLAYVEPDNPILAIFKGGNDDGYDDLAFAEQDNPILAIYKGGNDDGYDDLAFAEPDNPILAIYKGGNDDGYDDLAFAEPDNPILAIYKGGNDDGYDDLAFAEPDNPILAIYKGGNDDGYDDLAFAEPDNPILAIYKGGNDDGYDDLAFAEPDNPILAIYKGGNDDGYDFDSFEECLGSLVKWRGTLSIDWHTAANWECGIQPTLTSDVVIPGNAVLFPTVTTNDEIKSLLMQPGSTINIMSPAVLKLNGL